MKIRAFVMHHGARPYPAELVEALRPFEVKVSLDNESQGPWWNARRCWYTGSMSDASHVLVCHDDAVPSLALVDGVCAAVAARPTDIISLYADRPEVVEAASAGMRWVGFDTFAWGLGLILPKVLAAELLVWAARTDPKWQADDTRVLMWACETRRRIWCTVPSLLDHEPGVRSLVQGTLNKGAPYFGSGAGVDFSVSRSMVVSGDRAAWLKARERYYLRQEARPR